MKYILHTLGLFVLSLFSLSETYAQDTKWREVFSQDFGGNNANDPAKGDPLSADEVGSNLSYSKIPYGGKYCLVKTSDDNGSWHKGSDHTYLDDITRGYYMRIDPNNSANNVAVYRQKITGICSGVTFRFSAWMANLLLDDPTIGGSLPHLGIGIYEDPNAQTLVSPNAQRDLSVPLCQDNNSASLDWKPLEITFKTNNNSGTAYFIITAIAPEQNGFDFAIDDILIEVEQPAITITHTEYEYEKPVTLSASFVNNGFFSNLSTVKYKWQYSSDGVSFADISGSENYYSDDNKCSYTIPSFSKTKDNGYYRVVIGEEGNLGKPICSIYEDFRINETKDKANVYLCKDETRYLPEYQTTLNAKKLTDGQTLSVGDDFTLVINIAKVEETSKADSIVCIGSEINGTTYNSIGSVTISDTIQSVLSGCDSLIISQKYMVTGPTEITRAKIELCEGETFGGKAYNTPGNFTETTQEGCIKYAQPITVHPKYNLSLTYSICQGSVFNGKTYNNAGSFTETFNLQSVYGCDSVINATINVTEKIEAQLESVTLCEGEDSYTFDGQVYSAAGEYDLSSSTTSLVSGCDSITKMHLTIHPKYSNLSNPIDTMICYDSQLFGTIYPDPTSTPILVRDPQVYKTQYGCDSLVYYNVTVLQIQLKLKIKSDRNTVCQGEEVEIYIKDLKPSNTPLTWDPDLGGSNNKRKSFTPTEDLTCVVKARNDIAQCETTDTVRVYVRESPLMTIDSIDERSNIILYSVTGGTPDYSILIDTKQIGTETSGELKNIAIGNHKLWVSDANECTSYAEFAINPIPITPGESFTPNGDGINDTWQIENIDVYPKSRVRIYDRDGKLLAEYSTYDNSNGWDGTYQGKKLPSCDYWYEINLAEADKQYVGHFTLLR